MTNKKVDLFLNIIAWVFVVGVYSAIIFAVYQIAQAAGLPAEVTLLTLLICQKLRALENEHPWYMLQRTKKEKRHD